MQNRQPNRLRGYNYSQNGFYFVTICTQNHAEWFGRIRNGEMELNRYGETARNKWLEIPRHFENIRLDEFVIMPNHIHGIIVIENDTIMVGNRHACSLPIKRQYQTIPIVIGSYKSAATREINMVIIQNKNNFHWQKSFYDHIIRNESSLNRIREYINGNPRRWDMDIENMVIPGI
jgi:putative transposase